MTKNRGKWGPICFGEKKCQIKKNRAESRANAEGASPGVFSAERVSNNREQRHLSNKKKVKRDTVPV